jgi:hypothetical protein
VLGVCWRGCFFGVGFCHFGGLSMSYFRREPQRERNHSVVSSTKVLNMVKELVTREA